VDTCGRDAELAPRALGCGMPRSILASVHISSIYPASLAEDVPIETLRSDLPIPEPEPDVLLEHASFSTSFCSDSTGTMLIRIIHGGLILEIIPLSTGRPIRFSFPAPIIPSPVVLLHQLSELRIFVVTSSGSLFVLNFPVSVTQRMPEFDVSPPARQWCNEYLINTSSDELEGPVHVKDIDCVLVGMKKGRFLRLDCGMNYSE
jgi:nuclear pore complex protein Nup160